MKPYVAPRSHDLAALERIADRPEIGDVHARMLRETFSEVGHLREHLKRVQGVATRERNQRMLAEQDASRKVALCDAGADALLRMQREFQMMRDTLLLVAMNGGVLGAEDMGHEALCEAVRKTVDAVAVAPPPLPPDSPARKKLPMSSRWKEAEHRISSAVDAGQDPDPADMEIVREEAEAATHVQAAQTRVANSWLGRGTDMPEVRDLLAIDAATRGSLNEDDE